MSETGDTTQPQPETSGTIQAYPLAIELAGLMTRGHGESQGDSSEPNIEPSPLPKEMAEENVEYATKVLDAVFAVNEALTAEQRQQLSKQLGLIFSNVRGGVATARRNNLMNKVRQSGSDPDSLLADELTYQKDLGARITKALRPDQSS